MVTSFDRFHCSFELRAHWYARCLRNGERILQIGSRGRFVCERNVYRTVRMIFKGIVKEFNWQAIEFLRKKNVQELSNDI